jgi:uncharacterized protein YgbK (DUF1537 family)
MLDKHELFATLPPLQSDVPSQALKRKIVVLDDDPTGTQTVHGVTVATVWETALFAELLQRDESLFYVLTNTRSLTETAAIERTHLIVEALCQASQQTGVDFSLVSRGDSTLRGHFPAETDAAAEVMAQHGKSIEATILIPAFLEGGRITINDTHYLAEGDALVPVSETEFSCDPAFGFTHAHLPSWVEEKTRRRVKREDVISLSLELIRSGSTALHEQLQSAPAGSVIVANAADYADLRVLTSACAQLENTGGRFLFRSAASWVAAYGGIEPRSLLSDADLPSDDSNSGGLVVVGSHVARTTSQLTYLWRDKNVHGTELRVPHLLDKRRSEEIASAAQRLEETLQSGGDAVLYTSRERIENVGDVNYLLIGEAVSSALIEVVRRLQIRPRFLIAKGGITSSDIATQALGYPTARVLGQIEKGVAVWQTGGETRWPGMAYIVFPGNVGDETTLWRVLQRLRGKNDVY